MHAARHGAWFLMAEIGDAGSPIADHVECQASAHPSAVLHRFAVYGGRQLDVLVSDPARAVETPRCWLFIQGPRPPTDRLRQRLASAETMSALQEICSSPEAEDSSFLIVDKTDGIYCIVTDILNHSTVLYRGVGANRIFGSSLSLFPPDGLTLDLQGVASFLVNGNCINDRTVFREIVQLERASTYEFQGASCQQAVYWRWTPGGATGSVRRGGVWDPELAAARLWELLTTSVDRVTRGKRVLLSLTGGWDSSVLLGILARLDHPDVTCVTHGYGGVQNGSDAAVARAQAALYGYEHVYFESYEGDLLQMLDASAILGQGRRRPAYEIDALARLAERYSDAADSVMLFGDECVGMWSCRMRNVNDILGAARLKAPSLLEQLSPVLGVDWTGRLRAALEAEYDVLREKVRSFADADDAKDYLYLDQRLSHGLLPLRTLFAGRWFAVAMPLLARPILDFIAALPIADRVDKRLFRQMARSYLAKQFRLARSVEGRFHPMFHQEIARQRERLAAAIIEHGWKIDELLGQAELLELLLLVCREVAADPWSGNRKHEVKRWIGQRFKAAMNYYPLLADRQYLWRRLLINQYAEAPDRGYLLVNVLALSTFLARWPGQSERI